MSNDRDEARRKLGRLADALARDIDQLSDDDLLREATDDYGDSEKATLATKNLFQGAISHYGKHRLAAARKAYRTQSAKGGSRVFRLPLERKRELIEGFARNDNQLREKLTMAARNQEDFEADIDSFLEDLIELGVIDDEGNVR
jgi:hypothetical protein